ncbi:MAG: hypothetical protein Kow0029_00040 [Candidatus Rifleibacteriota bacterium]
MNLTKHDVKRLSLLAFFIFAYSFAYLNWYRQTPLGMTPVLDGAENIILADNIFKGTLPCEPFYRAMLYPVFLSTFRFLGFSIEDLQIIAGFTGIVFHLLNSILTGLLALQTWKNRNAFFYAMLFYGLYPVAIFFAADPLDITAGIFLLLISLNLFINLLHHPKGRLATAAGLILGIGTLMRPNILPAAGIILCLFMIKPLRKSALLAMSGLAAALVCGGLINYWFSGQFRIMPWRVLSIFMQPTTRRLTGAFFGKQ